MNKEEALESNWIKFFIGILGVMLAPIWLPVFLAYALVRIVCMVLIDFGDGILNGFEEEESKYDPL